jgi:hypothetical protein
MGKSPPPKLSETLLWTSALPKALGGPQSEVYLSTVETRQARVDALLAERAERDQEREPAEIEANLKEVWDDLTLEDQRRVLHSVFDSVFVWRTSDGGRNGKLPIAERARLFLAGEGRPFRSEVSGAPSAPFHSTVQRPPKRPDARLECCLRQCEPRTRTRPRELVGSRVTSRAVRAMPDSAQYVY